MTLRALVVGRKSIVLAWTLASFATALAHIPGTYTAKDYVQDGLVAHWDGREYCAYDVHPANGRYWVDLIGRRNVAMDNYASYTDDGVYFAGTSSVRYGHGVSCDLSIFDPSEDGLTLEVTVTLTDASKGGGILTAPAGTGIAIWQQQGNIYLASQEKGAQPILASVVPGAPTVLRLSVGYRNGEVVDSQIFTNGVAAVRDAATATGPAADANFYVCKGGGSVGAGIFHAIRVYNRLLTAAEVAKNAKIDACRYSDDPAFEVVSGSVTADGVTYAAGEKVYAVRGATAGITAATDAVIRPVVDGSARISVTDCSVTLEAVAADEMTYVESLTLGAGATLTLPSTGLGLNAAALTADATASVNGAGLLVSAASTSPVTLGANVTYRSAGGTFAGWPSSGVAYVPVGSAPTISTADDVAKVVALDAIVFLDDGTDAADATTVSCTATDGLALAAKLSGPGVFASASGGGVTVTGDNAHFLGNFDFSGVDVEIENEYGLGSSVTRPAKIARSKTSALVFDNGKNVFTNYAKVLISQTVSGAKRAIGAAGDGKKLVQAETLEFGTALDSDNVYLDYDIDLLKGYRSLDASHAHHYLYATYAGACHIYGEMHQEKQSYGWLGRANLHFHQARYCIGRMIQGTEPFVCEAPDVFFNAPLTPNKYGYTLDINGYDQHFGSLAVYNNASAAETGSATHVIDSATAAKVIVMDGAYTTRPQFTGYAGFEHATAAANTNVFAGVESTSKGELKVTSGTLILRNGYSWVGKKVTVAGGRLVLDSTKAIVGGEACVTLSGAGVLEIREDAACVVNKLVCGETTVEEPGDYTVASLKAQGFPIEGPDDFVVKIMRSYDVDWNGWPTTPGATAVVPQNLTVGISDEDVATVAALGAIDIGPGGVVVCTNTTAFALPKILGFGTFKIIDAADVTLANDSSGLLAPGGFVISNTCVTVTGKGGLGGVNTAAALVYCGTKDDVLVFTGAGLTNEVALNVWPGSGASGGFILGSPNAGEVFYQKADLTLKTGNGLNFRNVVHFDNGTVSYDLASASGVAYHFYASFIKNALAKEVWLDEGSTLNAASRRCFFSGGVWHLGGTWSSGQMHFDSAAYCVCERADALSGRTWSPYAGIVLDLNGYDQGGLIWAPEHDGSREGSVVTSAVPAKVTITATSYSTAYDTYAVAYRGKAGLCYAPVSGAKGSTFTTTWKNRFSDTVGPLDVAKATLVFTDGAGWGGTNVTIRSGAKLQVESTSAACAFKPAERSASKADLVIEAGGTLQLNTSTNTAVRSFVYDGAVVPAGTYAAGQYGLAGTGKLEVRTTPGRKGFCFLVH